MAEKKTGKWRHKWMTLEYRKDSCVIDLREVTRFVQGWVSLRWPNVVKRGKMQLDYGAKYLFWPSTIQPWSDGREVTKEERLELTQALRDWASDAGVDLEVSWSGE